MQTEARMWRAWEEGIGRDLDIDTETARHVTGRKHHSNMITDVQEQRKWE